MGAPSGAGRMASSSSSSPPTSEPSQTPPATDGRVLNRLDSIAQVTRASPELGFGADAGAAGDAPLAAWWQRQRRDRSPGAERMNPEVAARLTAELDGHAADLLPSERHIEQLGAFLDALELRLQGAIDGSKVLPFGSAVNGFWTSYSDVDVCVRVPRASTRAGQIKVLREIASQLSHVDKYQIEPRYGAQVPILHWAPRMPGLHACDISVNNVLAVVNSRLLGDYVRLEPRLRTLGLCVKAWAQARGINDRSRGTLSSFALVLMLIHFLQRRSPPVLPSLQDIAFSRSLPADYVNGVDCRYCTDLATIEGEMKYLAGGQAANAESTGELMLEFFRHFGYEYRSGVIRIRDTRSVLPPSDETGYYLVVDNPFEVGKDVANVDAAQHEVLKKEFRRGFSILKDGRSFRELLRDPVGPAAPSTARRSGAPRT